MLGVTYRDRVRNVVVLRRMDCTLSFVERIAEMKIKYAGYVISGILMLNILEGHVEGRSRAGKPWRGGRMSLVIGQTLLGVVELVSIKVI